MLYDDPMLKKFDGYYQAGSASRRERPGKVGHWEVL